MWKVTFHWKRRIDRLTKKKKGIRKFLKMLYPSFSTMASLFFLLTCSTTFFSAQATPVTSAPKFGAPTVTVKNGTYEGVHSAQYNQDFFLGILSRNHHLAICD
jgi:hypothetical protein